MMHGIVTRGQIAEGRGTLDRSGFERRNLNESALLLVLAGIALTGLVMVVSASMPFSEMRTGSPWYFALRQSAFLASCVLVGAVVYRLPLAVWEKHGPLLIMASLVGLVLVLIPGIGSEIKGSRRWIDLGPVSVQVSETVKLLIIVYLAGYLVRRGSLVRTTWGGFIRPLLLICVACALLLLEPDYGASVVIVFTALAMLFVAGVRFSQFIVLLSSLCSIGALLIVLSPYRMQRLAGFMQPFEDPFGATFQLSQSLIAIGRGSWTGVGLGNSVQKNLYLPEPYTDFLFAILAEELGFIGVVGVIAAFAFVVWRCFRLASLARRQQMLFASYLALGIGFWVALQSFINMGVNMGLLPTKGITLPLMSYGGSSALVFAVSFAILLRIESDVRQVRAEPDDELGDDPA